MSQQIDREKIQVWIFSPDSRRFLLLHTNERRGAFWQPVTGGVEPGEAAPEAAIREAREETGIAFSSKDLLDLDRSFDFESRGYRFREHGFALEAPSLDAPVVLDPHEHDSYRWVSAEEAFKLLRHPSNAEMLKALLSRLEENQGSR